MPHFVTQIAINLRLRRSEAESRAASPLRRWMASDDSSASTVGAVESIKMARVFFFLDIRMLQIKGCIPNSINSHQKLKLLHPRAL